MRGACRPAPRRRRAHLVRGLRAVPAALPDVPRHGRGGAVAARADRRDARRAVARRADRRRVRALHGDLRAVPRLRAGVPERRAVRPPDGGHPRRARPSGTASRRGGSGRRSPCSAATGRCSPGRRCWPSPSGCASCRGGPGSPALPLRRGPAVAPDRRRRVAVHRLRDGRLDARHPPRDGARCSTPPARRSPCPTRRGACCGALHIHAGLGDGGPPARRADDGVDAGRRRRSSSTRPGAARR